MTLLITRFDSAVGTVPCSVAFFAALIETSGIDETVIVCSFVTDTPAASVVVYVKVYSPFFRYSLFAKLTTLFPCLIVTLKFSLAVRPTVLFASSSVSAAVTSLFKPSNVKLPSAV